MPVFAVAVFGYQTVNVSRKKSVFWLVITDERATKDDAIEYAKNIAHIDLLLDAEVSELFREDLHKNSLPARAVAAYGIREQQLVIEIFLAKCCPNDSVALGVARGVFGFDECKQGLVLEMSSRELSSFRESARMKDEMDHRMGIVSK